MSESDHIFEELGLGARRSPELFRSLAEVAAGPLNGYSHVLRRAWKTFDGLSGVLNIEGRPSLYIRTDAEPGRISLREQRRFWSQGVAPMLVRVTPEEVQIYSGLRSPALDGEDVDANERLINVFERSAEALEMRQFVRSVESGAVYDLYREHFDPAQAVDRRLVENLAAARTKMSSGAKAPDLAVIHRMLGRTIFTCYLEARGALVGRDFGRLGAGTNASFRQLLELPDLDVSRRALGKLFRRLGRYFRGNLFEDVQSEMLGLRDADLQTLLDLLAGNDLGTGQTVLPFNVYDFSVIPIETISAVYEDFIRAEDGEAQREQGAYYTPPKLVEFTMDLATEGRPDLTGKRVLDPGCGSGVFLVSAFNRMAEAWLRHNPRARNGTRAEALATILRDQVCGVDVNIIACQAACFSLYMAMLDFLEPPEIRKLGKNRLPNLLLRKEDRRRADGPQSVIYADFLSAQLTMAGMTFDLVVGNPPWVARGNLETESLSNWKQEHKRLPVPANQIACAFMWEVPRYVNENGRACLLLPAGVLLGDNTDKFQQEWFRRHRVDKVAHLSDLRFFLFPGALHPTVAIRLAGGAGLPPADHRIAYLTPKASAASMFDNVITIEADDRKTVELTRLLVSAKKDEAAVFWLSYNWATHRDREFLGRLRQLPPLHDLVGEPKENKRWNKGQGFKPEREDDENPKKPFWEAGHPFLDANHPFSFLISRTDTQPVDPAFAGLHRAPDERLFTAPLVIFNKGFSKIGFAPFDMVFRHALQAISGPEADRTLLMFVTATLLSPLAEYFVFHLTSKAIYRGNPLLNEVLRIPFPLPANAPAPNPGAAIEAVAEIFARVSKDKRFGALGHEQLLREAKAEVWPHVRAYFDVSADEQILIEDTIDFLQVSATPSRGSQVKTLAKPTENDRQRYSATLADSLRRWGGHKKHLLEANCVVSEKAGVAVLTVRKSAGSAGYKESRASKDLDEVLERLKTLSPDRYGSLVYLRNMAVFETDRVHIIKPLAARYWLRSAALNDADAAADYLLNGKKASGA
jgi:hypothetical protein